MNFSLRTVMLIRTFEPLFSNSLKKYSPPFERLSVCSQLSSRAPGYPQALQCNVALHTRARGVTANDAVTANTAQRSAAQNSAGRQMRQMSLDTLDLGVYFGRFWEAL